MGFKVKGLRVWGLEFRVQGSGFRVCVICFVINAWQLSSAHGFRGEARKESHGAAAQGGGCPAVIGVSTTKSANGCFRNEGLGCRV